MTRDGRLGHSWRAGKLLFPGLASDDAAMIRAALALYETTGDRSYLRHAITWQENLEAYFADAEQGGYFLTATDAEALIVRPHSTIDDAIPNHNGLIAQNLLRLAVFTGEERWRQRADDLFNALLPHAAGNLFGHLSLLNALDMHLASAEIVITGNDAQAEALTAAALHLPCTHRHVLRAPDAALLPSHHPAQAMIAAAGRRSAAFVCRGQSCLPAITNVDDLCAAFAGTA
jgi:uncharacterized protein YyaL (SSP411 family)